MKFNLELGDTQKHKIEYQFNQLLGRLVVRLNNQEVFRRVRRFNEPRQEQLLIRADQNGAMDVLVEKQRRPLFGHRYRIFLNGRLYRCCSGL
jgi:hypothetical protein